LGNASKSGDLGQQRRGGFARDGRDDDNNITWEYGEAIFESTINLNEGET